MLRLIGKLYQLNIRITVSFLIDHLISSPISMPLSLLQRDTETKKRLFSARETPLSGVNAGANYLKGNTERHANEVRKQIIHLTPRLHFLHSGFLY